MKYIVLSYLILFYSISSFATQGNYVECTDIAYKLKMNLPDTDSSGSFTPNPFETKLLLTYAGEVLVDKSVYALVGDEMTVYINVPKDADYDTYSYGIREEKRFLQDGIFGQITLDNDGDSVLIAGYGVFGMREGDGFNFRCDYNF